MNLEAMSEMKIPEDIEGAVLDLKGLGELVTATEWQRAAIVYAFTYEGKPGGRSTGQECSVAKSMDEFSKLGLTGLSSRTTVRKYREAWKRAVRDGFANSDVFPGDMILLPDVEWDPYFNPPKPPRETAEKRSGSSTRSGGAGGSVDESEPGLRDMKDDAMNNAPAELLPLDATKPENKKARKGLSIAEGIETKRLAEKYQGGVIRIKEALTGIAKPDANYELLYLHMCQALGDLVGVLPVEE